MEVLPSKMEVSPPNIGFLSLAPKLLAEAVHFVPGPGGGGWLPGYRLELHLIRINMPLSKYFKYYLKGLHSPNINLK
jgi:hypothetical protein